MTEKRKTKEAALQVADLLSQALKIAMEEGSVGWVTAWLDARDELEGYGYTVELKEQVQGLEEEKADLLAVYPKGFPLDLSLSEQLQVEEFFRHLRDPLHRPAAEDRLEGLLRRCRGFKVEQLEQVLHWMDSHGWGELPFGPTEDLQEEIRELKAKLGKAAEKFDRQASRQAELDQALVEKSLELGSLRLLLQDPRMAFTRDHLPELPLEALQWIVEQETTS